jgi:hypothetical protein
VRRILGRWLARAIIGLLSVVGLRPTNHKPDYLAMFL